MDSTPFPRGETRTRRDVLRLAGGAALALGGLPLLQACGSGGKGPAATSAEKIVIAHDQAIPTLDPDLTAADVPHSAIMEICEPLIDYDATKQQLVPRLALSWQFVDDTTFEVKLRDNVTFSNGEKFTADAVKFTIERSLDPATKSLQASKLKGIQGVEVVDPLTARFHLSGPNALLPQYLATYAILPPQYTAANGDKLATALIGTGPYKVAKFQTGYGVDLIRNDTYWGTKAAYRTASYRTITSAETQLSALLSGEIQIAASLLPQQAKSLGGNKNIKVLSKPRLLLAYITLDQAGRSAADSPMTKKLVRQALNQAVDVDSIIKNILLGYGTRIASVAHPAQYGFDASIAPYSYDPNAAKQLLAQAGYPDGLDLRMISQTANIVGQADAAQAVQQDLAKIGVKVTLQTMTDPTAVGQVVRGGQAGPMVQFGNAASGVFDVAAGWSSFTTSSAFSYFHNAQFDQMYNQQSTILDPDQRKALLSTAQKLLHEEAPALFQWAVHGVWGIAAGVDWPGYSGREDRIYTARPA